MINKKRSSVSLTDLRLDNQIFITRAGQKFHQKEEFVGKFNSQKNLEFDLKNVGSDRRSNKISSHGRNHSGQNKDSIYKKKYCEANKKASIIQVFKDRDNDNFDNQSQCNDSQEHSVININENQAFKDIVLQILDEQGLHLKKNIFWNISQHILHKYTVRKYVTNVSVPWNSL